jgi:uncharacterized protein YndB with AHSA1/START domain
MPTMQHTLTIDRAPQDVLAALTAFDRIPEWIPAIERADEQSPGPTSPGSTFVEVRMLGQPRQIIGTVSALEPHRALSYEYATGPIPGLWEYRISADAEQSRLEFKTRDALARVLQHQQPAAVQPHQTRDPQKPLLFQSWVEKRTLA